MAMGAEVRGARTLPLRNPQPRPLSLPRVCVRVKFPCAKAWTYRG